MAPVTRKCNTEDHRRKRSTQLLRHEIGKISSHMSSDRSASFPSPVFRGSNSLPSLPSLHSTKSATFDLDVAFIPAAEQAPLLSPLKITRRAEGVRTDRSFESPGSEVLIEAQTTETPLPHAATSRKINAIAITSCRPSTRTQLTRGVCTYVVDHAALAAIDRRLAQKEEQVKSNVVDQQKLAREAAHEKHARQLEIARRRATVTAASQSFFDRLAFLPVRESIHLLETQREALLIFCLQQFRGEVDADELKTIQTEVVQMITNAEKELQLRLIKEQQEESQAGQRKIALQQLKMFHHAQIEQHLVNSREQRKQELAARVCVVKEQERFDRGFEARELEKQQLTAAHSKKLAEQVKNNAVARSTFVPAVQGPSPLYTTPWWSDESDERLKGFQRPITVKLPKNSLEIHCKKKCQWYD